MCPSPFLCVLFQPRNKIPPEIKSAAPLEHDIQLPPEQGSVSCCRMTHGHPASCRVSMQTSECLRDVGDELGTVSRLENNNRGEKKPSQGASKPVPETGGNQWSAFHRYLCTALCAALTPLNWCQLSDEGAKVATGPGLVLG